MPIFEEVRTVTANGRIVVPWVIQLALGLEHGGPVRFRVEDGVVTLTAAQPNAAEPATILNGSGHLSIDSRSTLLAELRTLQAASERDHGVAAASP
jgi:bifunctional DNA-binding transcriptional regulator/antitoxin component of YhaV-PrlF toxin-antitoxin module